MKLKVRFFLAAAFVAASAMPLAIFWLWSYNGVFDSKMTEVRERHLLVAQSLAGVLEVYHDDLVLTFEAFAHVGGDRLGTDALPFFRKMYFRHICIFEYATGTLEIEYLAEKQSCPSKVPKDRLALLQNLSRDVSVGISDVVHVPGEEPRLFIAARKSDRLVVGAIDTVFFEKLRSKVQFGRLGHAAIVDSSGQILAHPEGAISGHNLNLPSLPLFQDLMNGNHGVGTFVSPVLGQEMIAGYAPVPGVGWGVVVPQPLSELQEQAARFHKDALVIFSLGVLLSLAIALSLAFQFSRRLGYIATAVHDVAQEKDDVRVGPGNRSSGIAELFSLEEDVNRLAETSTATRLEQEAQNKELLRTNARLRQEMDERKLAEAAQRSSEIRFRSLFENAPIPIREEDLSGMKQLIDGLNLPDAKEFEAYVDAHPEFVQKCAQSIEVVNANRASLLQHGYENKQEMLSRVVRTLSPDAMKIVRNTIRALHQGELGRSYETRIKRLDGTDRTVAASWSVIPGHEETYARILLCSVDITERLKSEEALRHAQKLEAVGQLTGGVAHDFNNLLTVIGGNIDLLDAEEDLDQELIRPIRKAVRQGAELTHRLLAFSRKQPLLAKSIDLREVVESVTELMRRSIGEEVTVEIHSPDDLWYAYADPVQVETAILNLALNARDAMPEGGTIRIECRNARVEADDPQDLEPGHYVVLAVTDTGTGMSENVKARAFEPFFSTKEFGKGSGMGLSMVYGFAKQSNGDVLIESAPNAGTTVSLYLPQTDVGLAVEKPDQVAVKPSRGEGQTVLVLEDDPEVRVYLVRLIKSFGYRVVPAEDAHVAKSILDAGERIDFLVSDIMLPGGIRGSEFAVELLEKRPHAGAVLISGRPSEVNGERVALQGVPVLAKPFDPHELQDFIDRALRP